MMPKPKVDAPVKPKHATGKHPSHARYTAERRWVRNRDRRVHRFALMVAESQARRADPHYMVGLRARQDQRRKMREWDRQFRARLVGDGVIVVANA